MSEANFDIKYTVEKAFYYDKLLGITPELLAERHHDPDEPFRILCRNGIPCPIESLALIKTQAARMGRPFACACYAKDFAEYMWRYHQIADLTKVTAEHLEGYVRSMRNIDQKSTATIVERIKTISRIYDTYVEYHYTLDKSLYCGTQNTHVKSRRRSVKTNRKTPKTQVYSIMQASISKSEQRAYRRRMYEQKSYSKFLEDEQSALVLQELSQRDAAIMTLMLDTGLRNSSARTIKMNGIDFHARTVSDCFAKTGILVENAAMSDKSYDLINNYVNGERAEIVAETGESPYLFLNRKGKNKGKQMTYSALYDVIKRVEKDIVRKYPHMEGFRLHAHAFRSTFVNAIIRQQYEDLACGRPTISDEDIKTAAGVTSLGTLNRHYYDHTTSANATEKLREIANMRNERVDAYGCGKNIG